MARPKIVIIEWKDPSSKWGWIKASEISKDNMDAEPVLSVGLFIGEDDKNIYLAMDWHIDECNTQAVIRKDLIERYTLRELPKGYGKGQTGVDQPKKEEIKV